MKTGKDRLHRVLVIGANPAGIAAANKLGEMGIPVILVDPEPDLDEKLAREDWRLGSGLTLNYALRPGLLRILRNRNIRCVIPGEVQTLKHTSQGFSARIRNLNAYIDPERCTLCGRCTEVCPVSTEDGLKAIRFHSRQSLPGRALIDKRRRPLCQESCPLGVNAQGYIALARTGRFAEALELIRRDNVLPGICGRVCTHPCEESCRRGGLDEPLAIRDIKRFLADFELSHPHPVQVAEVPRKAEKIAVIGSGPAGLAAAADLARLGYSVTVFEKEPEPGGMLRYGIGPHRLPRNILDHELEVIQGLGVQFQTAHPVDLEKDLERLAENFAVIIVTIGAWTDRKMGVPGEDLDGVEGCLGFLARLYRGEVRELKENVAVIGDGNAAFDLARALVRLGARVTILSWFPRELIPADAEEIEAALEEGVVLVDRTQVVKFSGVDGKLSELRCAETEPGPPDAQGIPWPVIIAGKDRVALPFERAFVAIGQAGNLKYGVNCDLATTPRDFIAVDANGRTGMQGVYAAGDAATGPSSVVRAMASGREVAWEVHRNLSGEDFLQHFPQRPEDKDFRDIAADLPSLARSTMPERQPAARRADFAEVALGFNETQVVTEASRCLQCGVCSECLLCAEVCQAIGSIHHDQLPGEVVEQAGVVIIADPDVAPPVKGEDVIRAYSVKSGKTDVYAMMLRGFAAAAEAMILLGGSSQRLKGHGLSFAPPDPHLSPESRLGVFVCRCNDAFGWSDVLTDYVAGLTERPDVEMAEVVVSACTPEGSAQLLRSIRERGLTRVVLASCVCCPLDFVCTACTDQRSRLKDALFSGTGASRAMVETCNVRGEVLRLLQRDHDLAVDRFVGLIDRSISRAEHLKAMPAPARPYNFTTAVIGASEAAIKSAQMLAAAGMEVFHFGTPDRPLEESVEHPNIHSYDGSSVRGIRGTVGNFDVIVAITGVEQVLHVGAVILGEKSRKRIPYMPLAGLPPHIVESSMQQRGITGVPFFFPGATSIPGLFLANPSGVNVSERVKGAAAAILAASVMPRRPRQNKGYTVVVDESRCRGCGRCREICPYQAVSFRENSVGGWYSVVDEALCKGCGNCISVCPSNAADSPYRDHAYLEQMLEEILVQ